ncbi:hypothetical protein [Clostridium sp.]|uniref:hypothetical protein n=1 Tax=Clostridium sp. TaxID=1506 RepID=UPI001DE6FC49|nr:hypothetical protein [Clostridium sp.]MBS5938721.1 hypothetical protein [Clostridium sp.]
MAKRFLGMILTFVLPTMFLIGCKSQNIKLNVIGENINNIEILSLPESEDFNKTLYNIEDIDTIVKYLNSINPFITKENLDEYVGQSIIIKINYKDGSTRKYNHFGNKFIKEDEVELYEVKYDEAEKLEEIINNIK